MAIFAQPTPDENLKPGWNVQGTTSATGPDAPGYAQAGITGAVTTASQSSSGLPYPPNAEYTSPSEIPANGGSYALPVLENASYSTSLANAPAGTNPTAVGAVITLASAVTATVLSGLALVIQTGTEVDYSLGGEAVADLGAGAVIPAGAAVTTTAAATFITAGL